MSDETVDRGIRENYTIQKRLGKGAYGIVWRATDKRTGKTVALKKIFDAFRNVTDAQRTFREIIYLQGFAAHENIISLLDVVKADNDKDIYLVFDHMDADLHMVNKAKLLAPVHIPHVLTQCFKALHYMHTGGVIHRDLKPSNILMDDSAKAALADFGLARSVSSIPDANGEIDPTMTDYVATRWYRSPEILLGSTAYTCGTDMWSMGCILGEMLLGDPIFQGTSSIHQLDLITQLVGHPSDSDIAALNAQYAKGTFQQIVQLGKRRRSPQDRFPKADPQALDLLMQLLVVDPSKRLTTGEALQHPYLAPHMGSSMPLVSQQQVVTPFDDNQRLSIKDYRTKLYDAIKRQAFVRAASPEPREYDELEDAGPSLLPHRQVSAAPPAPTPSQTSAYQARSGPTSSSRYPTPHAVQAYPAPTSGLYAVEATVNPWMEEAQQTSHRAAHEDQSELDALKALSVRAPPKHHQRSTPASHQPSTQVRREHSENSAPRNMPRQRTYNEPSQKPHQAKSTNQAWAEPFDAPIKHMAAPSGRHVEIQHRVQQMQQQNGAGKQLMDIYGAPHRGGGSNSAGFNKRNQSSVFSADQEIELRPTDRERGFTPGMPPRSSAGWRDGVAMDKTKSGILNTQQVYRSGGTAEVQPRRRTSGTATGPQIPYGALRQQSAPRVPW